MESWWNKQHNTLQNQHSKKTTTKGTRVKRQTSHKSHKGETHPARGPKKTKNRIKIVQHRKNIKNLSLNSLSSIEMYCKAYALAECITSWPVSMSNLCLCMLCVWKLSLGCRAGFKDSWHDTGLGHQIVRLRLANKTVVCETIFQKCIGLSRIVIEGLWKANHSLMLAFECSQLMLDVYS